MVTYLCDIVFSQVQYVDLCDIGCVHSTYQPSLWSVTFLGLRCPLNGS